MANVIIPKKSTVAAKVPGVSDLALGEIAINHADQKLYARHPVSGTVQQIGGGDVTIDTTLADLLTSTSGTLSADDLGSDKIYFWDDSAGRAQGLEIGTGLAITGTTLNNTGGLTGTGSVDNSILRADGTGGSTLQNSGLVVEDTIVSFTGITGTASDDVITATGSAFANGQPVRFTALTGGSGLNTTTNYFVREVSGATFKVETSIGGGAINFTTNITAGTLLTGHSVQVNVTLSENTTETNSALVLTPKGTGALIAGPKPDGTSTGGNERGANAVDWQTIRANANQVASNSWSVVSGGRNNRASGPYSTVCGGDTNVASGDRSVCVSGRACSVSGDRSFVGNGEACTATGSFAFVGNGVACSASGKFSFVGGGGNDNVSFAGNSASGEASAVLGGANAVADRYAMQAHAGGRFAAQGDAQRAHFVLRNKTTNDTATQLFLGASANVRLTIPSGKVMAMLINITGVKSDGSAVAHYLRQYCLKNVAGTTSEVYAPVTIGTDNAAGTTIALSANDTNDALKVEVTGIASETWRWVASVDAVEIAYGN